MVDEDRRERAASAPSTESNSSTSHEATTKSLLKIVHQNVNGISADAKFNQVGLILSQVNKQDIEILTLNELNVNLADSNVRSEYTQAYRQKHSLHATQSAWAPTTITASKYRPGGNQVSLFGPIVRLVKERQYDKVAGSWSLFTIATLKGPLTIISAYRVSQNSLKNLGPLTVYSQEHMALQASGVAQPMPRQRCLIELERIVKEKTANGHMVLVNMDANEDINANSSLREFCDNTELIDLIDRFSPSQVGTPTYARGKKRIDYSFCSPNLIEFVISASIKPSSAVKIESDHTAIEICLDRKKLMRKDKPSHRPPARQLTMKNPASIRRYQKIVTAYFKDHKLLEKIEASIHLFKTNPQMEDEVKEEMLNQLDEEKTRYMIAAEKKCSKKKVFGLFHWSPILDAVGSAYSKAKQHKTECQRSKVSSVTLAFAKEDVKVRKAILLQAQDKSEANRQKHMQERSELLEQTRGTKARHIVDEIIKCEEAANMARKLKASNEKQSQGAISSVLIPDSAPGTWKKIEEPAQVEDAILKQNQSDLEYANQCPFLQEPLKSHLGNIGETKGADEILEGHITADTSNYPAAQELDEILLNMKRITATTEEEDLSEEAYRKLYRKIRESTASSPSGLHYGHYKAAVETTLGSKILHSLTTLPFEHGISLKRWQQSLHFMLQKKDLPYIQKLRIIQLFEADFNTTLKMIFSRNLMEQCDELDLNSDETFGARKGRNTHGALMTYQSNFGLAQLLKRNISILDSDATGCYDRIPHNLLNIAQQRLGCRKQFTIAHAKTLHNMIHKILTAHGISSKSFTKMLAGIGQGSCNGPSGWHSICEIIMEAYRKLNQGCRWASPNEVIEVLVWLAGFVDDVVSFLGFVDESSWEEALSRTQDSYRSWQKLLSNTGGSLSLGKSSYSMVYWIRDGRNNDFKMATKADTPGDITLEANNENVIITRKDPHEACKDLGIYIAPDGNMKQQFEYCLAKAKKMRTLITMAALTRNEADIFHHSRYMGWVRYFLPITTFSIKECNSIQSQVNQALIPKVGFNRHMPHAVIFGPYSLGGFGRQDLYTEQVIEHLRLTMLEIRKGTTAGKLLLIELDTLQLISGYCKPVLTTPRDKRIRLPETRLTYLWSALSHLNLQVEVWSQWLPKAKTAGDRSIMETVLESAEIKEKYSAPHLIPIFNKCRMYVRATMMSDMLLDSSTQMDPEIYKGNKRCASNLKWPRTAEPNKREWSIWKQIISRTMLIGGMTIANIGGPIHQPADTSTLSDNPTPNLTLSQILNSLSPLHQLLVGQATFPSDEGLAIMDGISTSQCIGASDGSVMDNTMASYGVKLNLREDINNKSDLHSISATGGVDGAPGHISSLRAESRGAIAIILLIHILCKKWPDHIQNIRTMTLMFDSTAVVTRSEADPKHRQDFLSMDYDLWVEMQCLIKHIPFPIVFKWIESHQDTNQDNTRLTNEAQLNIQVDQLAGNHRKAMTQHIPTLKIPAGIMAIGVGGVRHHHFPAAAIRQFVHEKPLRKYIIQKTGWSEDQVNSIEWESYATVLKSLPASGKVNWIKLAHDWQNTGHQKHLFNEIPTKGECPFHCGREESAMHFCECTADLAISNKTVHIETLKTNLHQAKTCPSLQRAIIETISVHCGIVVTDPFSPLFTSIRANQIIQAIAEQETVGINHLLKGRIVKSLFTPQLEYFERQPASPKTTPLIKWKGWKKKLIKYIVEFTLDLWNDRNSIIHGKAIQHSRIQQIAHVHHSVRIEYRKFNIDKDPFMKEHFDKTLTARLKDTARALKHWMQRVEASRVRQSLLKEAKIKIQQIQSDQLYIDAASIVTKSNRDLSKWIKAPFIPAPESQTILARFFST